PLIPSSDKNLSPHFGPPKKKNNLERMTSVGAAAAARSSAAQLLSSCTVFVKVSPLPITFAERRAVLHAMKKHGRIEVFKKLPVSDEAVAAHCQDSNHSPAAFISVAATVEAAQKLVAASPLTYDLLTTPPSGSNITPEPTVMPTLPQHIAEKQARQHGGPSAPAPGTTPPPNEERRQFVVHMFPSPNYNHNYRISNSPFYGPWKSNPYRKQPVIDALVKNIPRNVRQAGLAEWEHLDSELEELVTVDLSATDMWAERARKRHEAEEQPEVYKGLLKLQQEVEELRRQRILGQSVDDEPEEEEAEEEETESPDDQPPDQWLDSHTKGIRETKKSEKTAKSTVSVQGVVETTSAQDAVGVVAQDSVAAEAHDREVAATATYENPDAASTEPEVVPALEATAFFKQTLEQVEKMEAEKQAQNSAAEVASQLSEAAQADARDAVDRSKPDA
ncbi:hypothetical protein TD95_005248, partial [Thielaviopsis punctulata]